MTNYYVQKNEKVVKEISGCPYHHSMGVTERFYLNVAAFKSTHLTSGKNSKGADITEQNTSKCLWKAARGRKGEAVARRAKWDALYIAQSCTLKLHTEHTPFITLCWYSNFLSQAKERLNALLLCGQDWRGVSLTLFKVYENIWMLKCHWLCAFNRLWFYEKSVF